MNLTLGKVSAREKSVIWTSARPSASISLARVCIAAVMSVFAGPPEGGLYLNPPSDGGLCDGVITTPSDVEEPDEFHG